MEVHKAITEHSQKQNRFVQRFLELDQERERLIEEAVTLCSGGQAFRVDSINEVTRAINELARCGITPQRKIVTPEMVSEYVKRKNLNK